MEEPGHGAVPDSRVQPIRRIPENAVGKEIWDLKIFQIFRARTVNNEHLCAGSGGTESTIEVRSVSGRRAVTGASTWSPVQCFAAN